MKGAIIGDIVGSIYEFNNISTKTFPLFRSDCYFTDDTVLTCAVADWLLYFDTLQSEGKTLLDTLGSNQGIGSYFQKYYNTYPNAGYGRMFVDWATTNHIKRTTPSCGNGAVMRISPVGLYSHTLQEAIDLSYYVTTVTHTHLEAVRAAQALSTAIFLIKNGADKTEIYMQMINDYGYKILSVDQEREMILKNVEDHSLGLCQYTLPQAISCFIEGTDFEDCIRNAISIGGDSDTIAAVTGSLAEAYYGVSDVLWKSASNYLDKNLLSIVDRFYGLLEGNMKMT